jgi:hypothetical protein
VVHVSRAAAVAAVLAVMPATAADAGPRAGKIVRIERPRSGASGTPRICRLNSPTEAICWGRAPIQGEMGWVVGPDTRGQPGNRGQIQVGKVTPSAESCSSPVYWDFEVLPLEANMKDVESWSTWILFDIDVGPHARSLDTGALKDSPDPRNSPWFAIDRGRRDDADADADVIVTAYQCDEHGSQTNGSSPGYCIDYWFRPGNRWSMARRDIAVPSPTCKP